MNNLEKRYYDIKEMFKYAFSSIKAIIIVLIIGALLGVGFCAAKGNALVTQEANATGNQEALQEAKNALSTTKIAETEDAYLTYKSLITQRKYLQNYIKNSIYLNLDESSAKSNMIVFSISGNDKAETIVDSYVQLVKNNNLFKNINNSLKTNIQSAYISELISITDGNGSNTVIVSDKNANHATFTLTIVGKDEQQCEAITQCVKKRVSQLTPSLKKSFGNYSLSNSGDTYEPVVSSDVTSRQRDYNDKLSSVQTTITNLIGGLSAEQNTYLTALIDNNGISNTDSNNGAKVTHLNYKGLVLNAFVGAVILLLLLIIVRLLRYVFDQRIHSEREFASYFGVNIIADAEENKKIDENVITEELNFISKKNDNEKIGLLSSLEDNNFENVIYKNLKSSGVNCEIVSPAPESKEDFDKLLSVGKVVIFEKLGSSKFDHVGKILRYYKLKNIEVVGAVLIK